MLTSLATRLGTPIEQLLQGTGAVSYSVELQGDVDGARAHLAAEPWVASNIAPLVPMSRPTTISPWATITPSSGAAFSRRAAPARVLLFHVAWRDVAAFLVEPVQGEGGIVASLMAIWHALRTPPQLALGG